MFDFDPTTRRMRLEALHPGAKVEEVQERTGFEMLMEWFLRTSLLEGLEDLAEWWGKNWVDGLMGARSFWGSERVYFPLKQIRVTVSMS